MQSLRCHTCFPATTSVGNVLRMGEPSELSMAVDGQANEHEREQRRARDEEQACLPLVMGYTWMRE